MPTKIKQRPPLTAHMCLRPPQEHVRAHPKVLSPTSSGTTPQPSSFMDSIFVDPPELEDTAHKPLTASNNLRIKTDEEKKMFRMLIKRKTLVEVKPGTPVYLKSLWIMKSDKSVRLCVDGTEAQLRGVKFRATKERTSTTNAIIQAARAQCTAYATRDLRAGYYCIRLKRASEFLTTRISGRVFRFMSPPQGIDWSTHTCVRAFKRIFDQLGAIASFSDNAIWGADTFQGLQEEMKTVDRRAKDLGLCWNNKDFNEASTEVPFLGARISSGAYRPTQRVRKKYAQACDGGTEAQTQGYDSYFTDLYGRQEYTSSREIRSVVNANDKIVTDGQKGGYAAAVLLCGECELIKDSQSTKVPQSSQANAEQAGAMHGLELATKHNIREVYTDHSALIGSSIKTTINGAVKEFIRKRGVTMLYTEGGDANPADYTARTGKIRKTCKCGTTNCMTKFSACRDNDRSSLEKLT